MTLGECLLTPTKIYVKPILELIEELDVKGVSNITGGGFYENIPRCLNEEVSVQIDKNAYPIPPIFPLLQKQGNIPERDMYNTFNMGIGMVVIVADQDKQKAVDLLNKSGEEAYVIGEVIPGDKSINII